jgi:Holliday junction DNA helicase RuvA
MVNYIKGKIVNKSLTSVIVETGGFGIKVNIPISTSESIGNEGDTVKLLTYLSIKNEQVNLYGFATSNERGLFEKLVSVQGIGVKTALGILSEIRVDEFESAVVEDDIVVLTSIHGIGPKTAKRILFELKQEIRESQPAAHVSPMKNDAVSALVSLGYKAMKARELVERIIKENKVETLEELIKETLRKA